MKNNKTKRRRVYRQNGRNHAAENIRALSGLARSLSGYSLERLGIFLSVVLLIIGATGAAIFQSNVFYGLILFSLVLMALGFYSEFRKRKEINAKA